MTEDFWDWLPKAYGEVGDEPSFTKYNMEVAFAAGAEAEAKRMWVGLTDEVIWLEYQRFWPFHPAEEPTLAKDIAKFAHAIEAKLKERNT